MFLICLPDILERRYEVIQYFCRHHDAVSVGAYFFRDTYNPSSCIAFKVNEESFAICYYLFRTNDIVVHFIKRGCSSYPQAYNIPIFI